MLSDVVIQDVTECGCNIDRNRVGEQNQKRTISTHRRSPAQGPWSCIYGKPRLPR